MLPTACSRGKVDPCDASTNDAVDRGGQGLSAVPPSLKGVNQRRPSPPLRRDAPARHERGGASNDFVSDKHRGPHACYPSGGDLQTLRQNRPGLDECGRSRPSAYRQRSSTTTTTMRIRTRRPPPMYMTEPLPRLSRYEPSAALDRAEHAVWCRCPPGRVDARSRIRGGINRDGPPQGPHRRSPSRRR